MTEAACLASGGTFQGNITCADLVCAPGACCLPGGSCVYAFGPQCVNQGGVYRGDYTTCATADCSVCGKGGFYRNAQAFAAHRAQLGIASAASWDFTPHDLPPATAVVLGDPLNINTHGLNVNDPWTNGAQNFWPAALNNVQFSSNTTPNGPLTPRGIGGLTFATCGFFGNANVLGATFPQDSFDIVCESPVGGRCQAMAIELFGAGTVRVRVYYYLQSGGSLQQTDTIVTVPQDQKVFLGFIKSRIVRVDIWNSAAGIEHISSIALYRRPPCPDCGDGNGTVGITDFLALLSQWGLIGAPCDLDGGGVGITDFLQLLARWGDSCQQGMCLGDNPANGNCNSQSDCFPSTCEFTGCTPSTCICDENGQWICTDDCCGHCVG